jgi:hypothetical protein
MVDFKALVPWRSKEQTPATRDAFFDPFVTFRREMDRVFVPYDCPSKQRMKTSRRDSRTEF